MRSTWLRDSTDCPEVLRSAAHAQKHSERRQGSDSYDVERDTRLCKAAYDFNIAFVTANFASPAINLAAPQAGDGGTSAAHGGGVGAAALSVQANAPPAVGEGGDEQLLVDEEWTPLEGGPWVAKLMRPSKQPAASATYRNFYLGINFDPVATALEPGGKLKLPFVAGGPSDGLVLQLPASWSGRTRTLVFRLKLSKEGATGVQVTVNQVLFRAPIAAISEDEEEGGGGGDDAGGGNEPHVVPLANVPPAALAAAVPGGEPASPRPSEVVFDAARALIKHVIKP